MVSADILKNMLRKGGAVCVWALTIIVLAACLLFARLLYAPVKLDTMQDVVVARAAAFLPGWKVSYSHAEVGWDWRRVRPWLRINELSLIDRSDRMTVTVPEARVDVAFSGLFSNAGISTVAFNGANVRVTNLGGFSDDTASDPFSDLLKFDGFPKPRVFKPIAEAFSRFSLRLLSNAPKFKAITFTQMNVAVQRDEGFSDLSFAIPAFRLLHTGDTLSFSAHMDAHFGGQPTRFVLSGNADPWERELGLDLAANNIEVPAIADALSLSEVFGYFKLPIDLTLGFDLTADEGLRSASFETAVGEGALYDPVAYPERPPVQYGVISGFLDVTEEVISFDRIEASTGQRLISGNGLLYWNNENAAAGANFELNTPEVTIDEVLKYWPIKVHPDGTPRGARVWVDNNMLSGFARNVSFQIRSNPDGTTPFLHNSPYHLSFKIEETDTKYLKEMAPLKNVDGDAVLTQTAFVVDIKRGEIDGLPVGGSKVDLYDIHIPYGGKGTFDIQLEGPVQHILHLIDVPPVSISDKQGIDIDRLDGQAEVTAKINLPLLKQLPKESVSYFVDANVKDVRVKDLLGGEGLTKADVNLTLDADTLTAEGHGMVNGVPLDLYWRENFAEGRSNPLSDTSFLVMSGAVNAPQLFALGIDVQDYLDGKAIGEASFLGRNLKFRVGYFSADASRASLMVPQIGWHKEKGVPVNITGTLYLEEQGATIKPLIVHGEEIDLTAEMEFGGKDSGIYDLRANVRKLGKNEMQVEVNVRPNIPIQAVIDAEHFDAAPLVLTSREDQQGDNVSIQQSQNDTSFDLNLAAKKLHLLNGVVFDDSSLSISFRENEPKRFDFSGSDSVGETTLKITERNGATNLFEASTQDAGFILRGLALFPHLDKGRLELSADTSGWGDDLYLKGELRIDDTTLVAKQALSEDVTEGVISGVDSYLENNSLFMDVIRMPLTYDEGLLDISNMKVNGPSMGMTMEGQIDAGAGKINVNGVVVPAYGLNSLLGKIPIVGGIFSGGEGKGLFGVTYRVKGLTQEPNISVNPLSGIAPGFLRNLFEGRKGKVSTVEDPENEKTDTTTQPASDSLSTTTENEKLSDP